MVSKKKAQLILYREVSFIFLMFLLQKSIRFDALLILGYFAQKTMWELCTMV